VLVSAEKVTFVGLTAWMDTVDDFRYHCGTIE
jgi:hypothetical protein